MSLPIDHPVEVGGRGEGRGGGEGEGWLRAGDWDRYPGSRQCTEGYRSQDRRRGRGRRRRKRTGRRKSILEIRYWRLEE